MPSCVHILLHHNDGIYTFPVRFSEALRSLGETEDSFLTEAAMQQLIGESGFQVLGHFASSKENWELHVRPIYAAMQEIIKSKTELADEAQKVMNGFKAEYDAVGQHWNMLLWVAKTG